MGVEIKTVEQVACKYCGSEGVMKYGSYKGVPRYYCKSCKRKFKRDDREFKMKLPTEQVATALTQVLQFEVFLGPVQARNRGFGARMWCQIFNAMDY